MPSSSPATAFVANFPIPEEQPSRCSSEHALISPRSPYADGGFLGPPRNDEKFRTSRSRQCLLADDGNQRNFTFDDGGLPLADKWRRVNVVLPMPPHDKHSEVRRGGRPQPETENPFLRINHNLKIRIICRTNDPEPTDTVVILTTPIRFGTCPSTIPGAVSKTSLPAYLQLFHENGDLRECDPLPLYSMPTSEMAPSSSYSPPIPDYESLYPDTPSASSSRASILTYPAVGLGLHTSIVCAYAGGHWIQRRYGYRRISSNSLATNDDQHHEASNPTLLEFRLMISSCSANIHTPQSYGSTMFHVLCLPSPCLVLYSSLSIPNLVIVR